jgi:hypothetical protein
VNIAYITSGVKIGFNKRAFARLNVLLPYKRMGTPTGCLYLFYQERRIAAVRHFISIGRYLIVEYNAEVMVGLFKKNRRHGRLWRLS